MRGVPTYPLRQAEKTALRLYPKAEHFGVLRINGYTILPDEFGEHQFIQLAIYRFSLHGTTPFCGLTTAWPLASYTREKSPDGRNIGVISLTEP